MNFESFQSNPQKKEMEKTVSRQAKPGRFSELIRKFGKRGVLLGSLVNGILSAGGPANAGNQEGRYAFSSEAHMQSDNSDNLPEMPFESEAEKTSMVSNDAEQQLKLPESENRDEMSENIKLELSSLDSISASFSDAYFSKSGERKTADVFGFSDNAREFMKSAEKAESSDKIFDHSVKSSKKLATIFGSYFVAENLATLVHEIGHYDAYQNLGRDADVKWRIFGESTTKPVEDSDVFRELNNISAGNYARIQELEDIKDEKLKAYWKQLTDSNIFSEEARRLYNQELDRLDEENYKIIAQIQEIEGKKKADILKKIAYERSITASAGINRTREVGEMIALTALGENGNGNDQFLALMALVSKGDGFRYSMETLLSKSRRNNPLNDISNYSKSTGVPVEQLALGLAADFLLDTENYALMKIALGEDGVKLPKTVIAPFYKLEAGGPAFGIRVKKEF